MKFDTASPKRFQSTTSISVVRQAASEGQPGAGTFVGIQAGQREDGGGFLEEV